MTTAPGDSLLPGPSGVCLRRRFPARERRLGTGWDCELLQRHCLNALSGMLPPDETNRCIFGLLVCMEEAKCVVAAVMSSGIGKANLLFRLRDLRLYLKRSVDDNQLVRGWGCVSSGRVRGEGVGCWPGGIPEWPKPLEPIVAAGNIS